MVLVVAVCYLGHPKNWLIDWLIDTNIAITVTLYRVRQWQPQPWRPQIRFMKDGMTMNSPWIWRFLKRMPLVIHVFHCCGHHGIPCGHHGYGRHGLWPSWYRPPLSSFTQSILDQPLVLSTDTTKIPLLTRSFISIIRAFSVLYFVIRWILQIQNHNMLMPASTVNTRTLVTRRKVGKQKIRQCRLALKNVK